MSRLLIRLWGHINRRRRGHFTILLFLMLFASLAEVVSIGAVLPFLGVMTAPDRVFAYPAAQPIYQALGILDAQQLLLPFTIAFAIAAFFAGAMRLLLLWANTRLSFATGADLSISIYRRTLYQPYSVHCARNSSEVISGISGKANTAIYSIVLPLMSLISSGVMLIAILLIMLAVEPIITMMAFGSFGLIYLAIVRFTRRQLLLDSQCQARESVQVIKSLQEGLGGIRDVLIDGSQNTYCELYNKADLALRRAQGNGAFMGASPRYAMEALGMILIAALAYSLSQQSDGIHKAIPVLGALAVGAQRMLPVLQQAYSAWTVMHSAQASLLDTLDLLDQPLPDYANTAFSTPPLPFTKELQIKQLSFCFNINAPLILNQINLTIAKGSRVGIVGTTGSGKSTLLDIVMGLLQPSHGALEVDGQVVNSSNNRAWQAHIAHVPQTIFLADSTIEENIAFGVPKDKIDRQRVRLAAQQAQIASSIETWPEKYQTFVGERGVRLSGGQRQRIGIARALYKQADVIIFDEATSALDNETEQAVMQAIESLSKDLTLLIIAHRLTTLKNCTQIVEMGNGGIIRTGTYEDIMSRPVSISPVAKETIQPIGMIK